ncbi:hypothetical protein [Burkholderia cenocepacia]|uniref:hypothetical protein n=1 Tax=Burkholderia cenocepacia TaxID=95486 RepID=UPI00117808D4|nr:hypothetical protein [Burkholderia cenocepacia]
MAKQKISIENINKAMNELQAQGIAPNTQKIADILGVTRQAVHLFLIRTDKLNEYHQIKNSKKNEALEILKNIDTKDMQISDIYKLVSKSFDGNFMAYSSFLDLVEKNNVPHKETYLDKLSKIDSSKYTSNELHEMFGKHVSLYSFRSSLYGLKIPYKKSPFVSINNKKNMEYKALAVKVKKFDTSGMSIKQIQELPIEGVNEFRSYSAIYNFIEKNNIPHKKLKSP